MFSYVCAIYIDPKSTKLNHTKANAFPTKPVPVLNFVGIPIEWVAMYHSVNNFTFCEDADASPNETTKIKWAGLIKFALAIHVFAVTKSNCAAEKF